MVSMKGVSPIISVILLIAVSISVGIMVTTWITHWVVTQTGSSSISCAIDTNYVIDSAEFNKSTALNNSLLVKITNKGSQKIYGFGAILDNGTAIVKLNSSDSLINQGGTSLTSKLDREQSAYIVINLTNIILGYPQLGRTLTEVKVTNDACSAVSSSTKTITVY